MYIATLAWLCLCVGLLERKRRPVHVAFMLSGILLDIGLVLYLQFTKDAIQTALGFSLAALKQVHIGFSTGAFVLYFPVLFLGAKLLGGSGTARTRSWHIRLAVMAFILRSLGFVSVRHAGKQTYYKIASTLPKVVLDACFRADAA